MMIKPIETVYNGYRFRSRLEARWAVFFDALGIKYKYEIEGFDLDGIRYLPDFWLPDHRLWFEAKPSDPSGDEWDKAVRLSLFLEAQICVHWGNFSLKSAWDNILIWTDHEPPEHIKHQLGGDGDATLVFLKRGAWQRCAKCGFSQFLLQKPAVIRQDGIMAEASGGHYVCPCDEGGRAEPMRYDDPVILKSYTAARQARFGQNGRG